MSGWSRKELEALCQKLSGEDPRRNLDEALEFLAGYGLTGEGPGEPSIFIEKGAHVIRLWGGAALGDDAAIVKALLEMALAGVATHEELQQTRERMEMLSGASFEGILIHVDGVVVDTNQRLAEILGAPQAELLGPETMRSCVAPEDLPSVIERMRAGYEGAYVITGVRKDGTRFRAELQSKQGKLGQRPVRVAAVRDVTERERVLELLRESERRLRDLAYSVFDLTVLSRDGVIVDVGGEPERLLALPKADLVGRPVLDFVAPPSLPMVQAVLSEQRTGAYRAMVMSADGDFVPVEIVGVSSTLDGQATRVAGLRDLREAQRLELERRRLEQRVERSERLNSLGVLAGGIAHDFNNLLVGVLGNADLLLETTEDLESREMLRSIVAAGRKAAALTQQMLAYAGRGDRGRPEALDMFLLVKDLRSLLAARLSKRAEVTVNIAPECIVVGDRTTLTQVLLNLLINASDALDQGVGKIEVLGRRVQRPDARWDDALGATVGPGDWVLVEVRDTGHGMNEATLGRIFEPFFSTKADGHGLGLAACLGIITAHGGALRVESQLGRGSCFSLLLPRALEFEVERALRGGSSLPPCRVLVVDDEAVVRVQLRRCLELRGFSVTEAETAESGLSALRAQGADLVVLDMTLPDLDGAETARRIRALGSSVPIVLTSGYPDAAMERKLAAGSFQAFLRKPYSVAELVQAIQQARAAPQETELGVPRG